MKSIKEIEQMAIEELEVISFDEKIDVPQDLGHKIQSRILSKKKKPYRMVSAAAAITIIVSGLGISLLDNEPKDTFDNPYMAYAELEKAFAIISEGMKKGMDIAETSETVIKKSTEIFK
jgi:hypothetical protein